MSQFDKNENQNRWFLFCGAKRQWISPEDIADDRKAKTDIARNLQDADDSYRKLRNRDVCYWFDLGRLQDHHILQVLESVF